MSNNLSNTQMNVLPHEHDMSDIIDLDEALADKQDKLIAGTNIHIAADGKTISADNTEYSSATSEVAGIVKLGSDTVQSTAFNSVSSTNQRTYAIQVDGSGRMVVNVPWSDTTVGSATSTVAGTVKLGSDTVQTVTMEAVSSVNDRTYGIQYNGDGQMVVNIPWENTTYSVATNSNLGLVKLYSNAVQTEAPQTITTTTNRTYAVQLNNASQMVVNVPWEDTHVTVVDNLTTANPNLALSANQGTILKGMIDDLNANGRFLSLWDCEQGLAISFPRQTPYAYKTGDYFMVEILDTTDPIKQLMPNGVTYTGTASSTEFTGEVKVGDFFIYDGSVWLHASNHGKVVSFANLTGQPSDNTNLATALNAKQDNIIAGNNITIGSDGKTINAIDTTYSGGVGITLNGTVINADGLTFISYGNSTWQDFIDAYENHSLVYCRASSNSDPATGSQTRMAFMAYVNNASNPTEVEFQYYRSRSSHSTAATALDEVYVYKLVPSSGGTWTVTQRDTAAKPLAGTGIGLTYNASGMTISADTTTLATKTDLSSKQDTLVAGENITIDQNNEISADVNTKTFQGNRGIGYFANAQAVYDRISTGKYAIVEVRNVGDDWKGSVVFGPTNITTGTISSWEYTHATQSPVANGLYYEEYMKLVIEVVDGVVTQAYDSGSTINNSGHLVVKGDTAPSNPIQGSVWYDKINKQLKIYDGTNWNQVGGGLQESPNSTITGIKYIRHGTEADYANLSQYYTDTPGDTEFHCF